MPLRERIRNILTAWLIAAAIEYLLSPERSLAGLEGLAGMSLLRVGVLTCVLSFVRFPRWGMACAFTVLAGLALWSSFSRAFLWVCGLVGVVLAVYARFGWDNSPEPLAAGEDSQKGYRWVTIGLSAAFFLFVCVWSVSRVISFRTPTYDFGIFSQMFWYMKETGLPLTTLERDGLLSHFAVHVSPIYYLMLPFYCLFPSPATLQILQAAVVTSAVIPLWKLGKAHGLSGGQRGLVCGALLVFPVVSGGCYFDLHENCFLMPLILWLFYGIDRKNTAVTALAALLTLAVKEDAAVYVAVIGLWLIVKSLLRSKTRGLVTGAVLLAVSLACFLLTTGYLTKLGDGVMTYRYNNFLYGSSSLLTVVKAVLLHPMKAVYECVDPEKLYYIAMTMLPLLGLPLMTRRYERYLLLIPYVLVNLMSDYGYQHSIWFQYSFGSAAFLVYLTVVNLADLRHRTLPLIAAVAVGAVCFATAIVPVAVEYPVQAIRDRETHQSIRAALDTIPTDASVTASTFYTTYLSQRETIYDLRYSSRAHLLASEYVVIDPLHQEDWQTLAAELEENGFVLSVESERVLIYRLKKP